MARKSANTAKSGRKKTIPKSAWKPGQSGNPKGAPKRGESWQEVWKRIGDMDGPQAAEYGVKVAAQLKTLPAGVSLKEAVAMRVYVALMNEPDARLLSAIMDRGDGKVKELVEQTGKMVIRIEREGSNADLAGLASGAETNQA